jgi:hypothetical protein
MNLEMQKVLINHAFFRIRRSTTIKFKVMSREYFPIWKIHFLIKILSLFQGNTLISIAIKKKNIIKTPCTRIKSVAKTKTKVASWSLIVLLSTELSIERDEEGNIQMYLQDLITCNKITIIQKLEVLFLINIRHISIRFWSLQFQAEWIVC